MGTTTSSSSIEEASSIEDATPIEAAFSNEETYYSHSNQGLREHWRELLRFRYLFTNLVVRDLKVRYRNSALGIIWSLLNPLAIMGVFTLVFNVFPNQSLPNYPVFILVGLLPWNFFNGSILGGSNSIVGNANLVKKVYFPRELLPASVIFSNLVHFLVALVVLIIWLYGSGLGLTVHALWVPVLLITQIFFMLGLSFFLSALQVFYRDVAMFLEVAMLALFFLTPVFYSLETFGNQATLAGITFDPARVMRWINPLAAIIDGYRTVLWGTVGSQATGAGAVSMDPLLVIRTFVTAVIVFVFGYAVFYRLQPYFGEKL